MEVMYSYHRAAEKDPWKTELIMKADNLSLHINHQQYIMMLNSLDHQLKDIRDVASMRDNADKDKGKHKEEAASVCTKHSTVILLFPVFTKRTYSR
jgi:hypothetical protein